MSSTETANNMQDKSPTLVEQRGIDFIPLEERHGRPMDLFWMWAGALVNVQTVAFGALVFAIGLSLTQSLVVILIANLSWVAAGVISLVGPAAGTTALTITRAAFGPRAGRVTSVFNWISMVIYEIATIVLAVFAGIAMLGKLGAGHGFGVKLGVILFIGCVQFMLPVLGHTAILKVLKYLTVPFVLMFVVMAILTIPKVHSLSSGKPASWGMVVLGLGVALSVTGFSFMSLAPDYSRYLPPNTSPKRHIIAVTLGGLLPMAPLMCLGAALATVSNASDPISGLPTIFPTWFIYPYLLFAIVQILCLTSLDIYSSGMSLIASGLRIRRTYAAALDTTICGIVAGICVYYSIFYSLISTLLLFNMVWLAPWGGIVVVDYFLRRGRYDTQSFFVGRGGQYWQTGGVRIAAAVALGAGIAVSLLTLDTSAFVGPISNAMGGADISILASFVVGALLYYVLARQQVHGEVRLMDVVPQRSVSAAEPLRASAVVEPPSVD